MTALLTDNLPLLAGAPNGIKKLRELILELAVRGKLVPQYPSDEPASELLKQIAEEKARLVAAGKNKEQKALAEIGGDGEPFELPAGWKWGTLAQVAFINPRNAAPDSLKVSFVPMTFIGTRFDDQHAQESRLWGEVKNGFTHFAEGDIGVAKITPCFENSKACVFSNLVNGLGAGTTELHIVRPIGGTLDPRFVLAYLKSPQFLLVGETKMTGTAGQKRLPKDFVETNPFPLPPLLEQHRIVAKVDELMALCDRLDARQADADSAHAQLVQALLDSLTQACDAEDFAQSWQRLAEHFHTLFTTEPSIDALKQTLLQLAVMGKLVPQYPNDESASEFLKRIAEEKARLVLEGRIKRQSPLADVAEEEKLFALPSSWVWVRLEGIAQVGTGATPMRTNPKYFDPATVNWLTSGETSQDFIRVTEQKVSSLALTETNLTVYPPHTLIIAMYGQGKTRGQISELLIDACTNQACAAIQLFDPNPSHRRYVKHFFVKSYDDLRMLAAGGAQPNLNLGKIKDSVIPLPPLAEQHRIVAKVDQLMALCDQLKSRLSEARQVNEHLANALIGQALNNEKKSRAETVDFSAYLISKLAPRRTFGRVAHMKLLFLADSHLGLGLMDGYRRHAAGPLDTTIYRVEERAAQEGLYSTSIEVLKSGQEKVSYHIGANISRSVETAASAIGSAQKELDRLIALFEGRKTDDLEAVATLYAVWNDALAGGLHPNDEWLISEFRGNWHEAKERFTPDILGKWLGWMRDNGLVPTGNSAVTKSQAAFLFN
ncbi:type I restriction endonuclease subunit S [Xanthomonas sp. MLO165]|uniref:restriction endonuclease subunit S n=1 Tax=Xanthomonas sp. MLO165 TaxID=2081477 RepID=UPI001C05BF38|nr:restriction endonuclease subunit S [Xanthomonas sp. MLO165]QWM98878.1 type I restriction endonuclease subunit S [Xanthomonas sp. MLO165]